MKNVLFASTALVAFAGAAAADVTVSGSAEMGIFAADGVDWQFHNDVDVTFTLSGETDNGLAFGASVDLDEAQNLGNEEANMGVAIFLSGAFGTLTMGDTDGAVDWALTEVNFNSGSIRDDETSHAGWNGNSALDGAFGGDNQVLRYDYTMGDFAFAVSLEQIDNVSGALNAVGFTATTPAVVGPPAVPAVTGTNSANDIEGEIYGVGFKYSADFGGTALNFGLGYQNHSADDNASGTEADGDAIGASVNATFGSITAGISYLSLDVDVNGVASAANSYDHIGVGIGYSEGPISANANYGNYDYDDGTEASGFGLSAGYSLGGGATIQAGYGNSDNRNNTDTDTFSFGVQMSF